MATKTLVDTDSIQTVLNKSISGQGTTTIDFGTFPGTSYAKTDITGQASITATSIVHAEVVGVATADHTADEHMVDPPRVTVSDIAAAAGFTIHGFSYDSHTHHGLYTVKWSWHYGT